MYFDTRIISDQTKDQIISLVNKYPITKTNEQVFESFITCKKNTESYHQKLAVTLHTFIGNSLMKKLLSLNN